MMQGVEKEEEKDLRKEEVRGLIALGLLGVLVAYRFANPSVTEVTVSIFFVSTPFPIADAINSTIILWGLYAIFLVIGLSDDILPVSMCTRFRKTAPFFLFISYFLYSLYLYGIVIDIAYKISPNNIKPMVSLLSALILLGILFILIGYSIYSLLFRKSKKIIESEEY